jgi:hypothetical protein
MCAEIYKSRDDWSHAATQTYLDLVLIGIIRHVAC